MGLAISRSIIETRGGRLWAKASAPQGAVFQFTLPIRDERAVANSHIPIIFITAHEDDAQRAQALEAGRGGVFAQTILRRTTTKRDSCGSQ